MDNEALIVELETNEARQRDYDDKVTQKLDSLDQVSSSSIFFTINDIIGDRSWLHLMIYLYRTWNNGQWTLKSLWGAALEPDLNLKLYELLCSGRLGLVKQHNMYSSLSVFHTSMSPSCDTCL